MRTKHALLLLLACVALPAVMWARQSSAPTGSGSQTPTSDPQAITVVQSALAAMGAQSLSGVSNVQEVVSLTTYDSDGPSTTTVTITTNGASLRMDSQGSNGTSTLIMDANRAQMQSADGVEEVPRSAFGGPGFTQIPLLSMLAHWQDQGAIVKYVGEETDGTSNVRHIRLQTPPDLTLGAGNSDAPCEIYFDSQSLLMTKLIYDIRSPADLRKTLPITVAYQNYKVVSGLAIPFSVTYTVRGTPLSNQVVQDVIVNAPVTTSEFQFEGAQ